MATNRSTTYNNTTQIARRLLPVGGTYASLAVAGPASATFDTVVEAVTEGPAGNLLTLATVADGTGAGTITETSTAVTFHYETGVTTVAQFESTLGSGSTLLKVKTAGTGANVLSAAGGDTFSATNLTAGGATASAVPTLTDMTAGVVPPFPTDRAVVLVRNVDTATGVVKTATVRLWGACPVTNTWFAYGTGTTPGYLNGGVAIPEISTAADKIAQAEAINGLRPFSRLYAEIIGALGGAGTEIEVWVVFVKASPVTEA